MSHFRLPVELIVAIFELLYYTDGSVTDRNMLKNCSLVCATWRDPAQKLLFRSGHLRHDRHSLPEIDSIFSTLQGQLLSSYVRSLRIIVGQNVPSSYSLGEFVRILQLFPRLYDLQLVTGEAEFPENILQRMNEIESTSLQIKSLELYYTGPSTTSSTMLYQMLAFRPSIKFLFLGRPVFPTPPAQRPDFQLFELAYHRPPSAEVLDWLVPNHSLRIFNLGFRMFTPETSDFLDKEGRYLRSLRIPALNDYTSSWIAKCPNLEEIYLEGIQLPLTENILGTIPGGLQHLLVHDVFGPEDIAVRRVVQKLQHLHTLTLPKDLKLLQTPDMAALRNLCTQKGVEISYDAPAMDWVSLYVLISSLVLNRLSLAF